MNIETFKKEIKTKPCVPMHAFDPAKSVAYHEAGHALPLILNNIPFGEITIIPVKGESAGHQKFDVSRGDYSDCFDDTPTDEQENELIMQWLLGGIIAEAIYTGAYNWEGAGKDIKDISKEIKGEGLEKPLQYYWDITFATVTNNWQQVSDLAEELFLKKTLYSKKPQQRWTN